LSIYNIFSLWLHSPIFGFGRFHETFRFISVTRSRRVGWTPWTGDQIVARPLLTAPGDCDDDGEAGGIKRFWQGKDKYLKKSAPTPLCPPQIPLARPGIEAGPRVSEENVERDRQKFLRSPKISLRYASRELEGIAKDTGSEALSCSLVTVSSTILLHGVL
jgi:hypothetical protein